MNGRLSLTLFAAGIGFLCAWTLGVQVVTLTGLPFKALSTLAALALVIGTLAAWRAPPVLERIFLSDALVLPGLQWPSMSALPFWPLALVATLLAATLETTYRQLNAVPLWGVALLACGLAVWRARKAPDLFQLVPLPEPRYAMPLPGGTVILALLLLAYYFFSSLPDSDDALFLNFAAGARRSAQAVYGADTMLGIPGLPFIKSTYKLESYSLLAALIAQWTGLSTLQAAHIVIPAGMCVLGASILALVHAALFRRWWFATVLIHMGLLMALDGGICSFGYHAIPRMFHGKAPFVTFMVPLLCVLTLYCVRQRSWAAIAVLGAVLVTSIGLTANALYAAPLAMALVAAPGFLLGDRATRLACCRLVVPVLYAAALAAYLVLFDPPSPSEFSSDGPVAQVLRDVFVRYWTLGAAVALIYLGACGGMLNRRFSMLSLYTALVLLLLLNPWLNGILGTFVTGHVNYRLLWAVPVPLAMAVVAGMILASGDRRTGLLLGVVLLAAVAAPDSMLRRVKWGFAGIKVAPEYTDAQRIEALAGRDELILAPEEIARNLPVFDDYRPVVESRAIYAPQRVRFMSDQQYRDRNALFAWASHLVRIRVDPADVPGMLDRVAVGLVVVRSDGAEARELREPPFSKFRLESTVGLYEVWQRVGTP